ncbi:tetratricopeptide repeat protein [Tamlana crocina]|uniref:Tetratricopeptide repeat protein n=1 Tax=Tamlana crocina TaxID=393006 RepID=A0ABX1D8X8_9FLAO|nr:tetratricopeptide repeat protein [Tamlana crocina]NJX14799.1 tetratricopeptide repeat protein [Tamlana crocina]
MIYRILLLLQLPLCVMGQTSLEQIPSLIENKQFELAEKQVAEVLKTNPENLKAVELLGDAYSHQKKWDAAIEEYNKLVEAAPKNANYHYKYGGALGMKALENKMKSIGFIGDVKDAFLTAAELDPNHMGARWALVELYMQLPGILGGSKTKALKFANELEALSKVDGYLAKGYIYEYDDEPELAEKHYKMAVKTGGSLLCYDKLTQFYLGQNQPEKALANLYEAYKKHQKESLLKQIKAIEDKLQ